MVFCHIKSQLVYHIHLCILSSTGVSYERMYTETLLKMHQLTSTTSVSQELVYT